MTKMVETKPDSLKYQTSKVKYKNTAFGQIIIRIQTAETIQTMNDIRLCKLAEHALIDN